MFITTTAPSYPSQDNVDNVDEVRRDARCYSFLSSNHRAVKKDVYLSLFLKNTTKLALSDFIKFD